MTDTKFCSACSDDRKRQNRPLRQLVMLRGNFFEAMHEGKPLFKDTETPIYFCEFCDGDALPRTRTEMLKRAG